MFAGGHAHHCSLALASMQGPQPGDSLRRRRTSACAQSVLGCQHVVQPVGSMLRSRGAIVAVKHGSVRAEDSILHPARMGSTGSELGPERSEVRAEPTAGGTGDRAARVCAAHRPAPGSSGRWRFEAGSC